MTNRRGFTLIELLVVVSIIGLLSSIILGSLNGAREKARAVRTLQDLKTIELALILLAFEGDRDTWWTESELGGGPNPLISWFITDMGLGTHLSQAIDPISGVAYKYDNDSNIMVCNVTGAHYGVNIILTSAETNIFEELDRIVDGKDGNTCGKIKMNTGNGEMYYQLGIDTEDY